MAIHFKLYHEYNSLFSRDSMSLSTKLHLLKTHSQKTNKYLECNDYFLTSSPTRLSSWPWWACNHHFVKMISMDQCAKWVGSFGAHAKNKKNVGFALKLFVKKSMQSRLKQTDTTLYIRPKDREDKAFSKSSTVIFMVCPPKIIFTSY